MRTKVCGPVIQGDKRGQELGFPTANVEVEHTQAPDPGVYAGFALVNQVTYLAAIHIGPRPTFNDQTHTVEAHILDFSQDIYGMDICLILEQKLRDVEKFDTIEALQAAITQDCNAVRKTLSL